jgi:hypothetical protein
VASIKSHGWAKRAPKPIKNFIIDAKNGKQGLNWLNHDH